MYSFYESVNNDQYQVVAIIFLIDWDWKAYDKVH